MDETVLAFYSEGNSLRNKVCGCFTSTGAYGDGKECLRILELAFGVALKMKIVPGIILESKDMDDRQCPLCYRVRAKNSARNNVVPALFDLSCECTISHKACMAEWNLISREAKSNRASA